MLQELFPLIGALTLAVVVYVVRERRRERRRIAPKHPRLRMSDLSDAPALLEMERAALASDDPRTAFRRAALENAVASLYLEAVDACGIAGAAELRQAHENAGRTLRQYVRLKYDDAVPDDWYDYFVGIARPYIREKVRLTREFALHLDEGVQRYAKIYDQLLRELFEEALHAPQKKSFVPPDFSHS